jgi:hypothetical protein
MSNPGGRGRAEHVYATVITGLVRDLRASVQAGTT